MPDGLGADDLEDNWVHDARVQLASDEEADDHDHDPTVRASLDVPAIR